MKNKLLYLILFTSLGVFSQIVNIPDNEFKQALLNYSPSIDTNNDNQISVQEAQAVTTLNISNYQSVEDLGGFCPDPNDPFCGGGGFGPTGVFLSYGISDFTGIEAFTNLTSLTCSGNELSSLDVSTLSNLIYLDCSNNINYNTTSQTFLGISSLILPSSSSLETLISSSNNLVNLDLSQQNSLEVLSSNYNRISTINFPTTNILTNLSINNNKLTTLNLSPFLNLTNLDCSNNKISTIILPSSGPLAIVDCRHNELSTLDISASTSLINLKCNNNTISSLTLPNTNTFTTLECSNNQLPNLDISSNIGLTHLSCSNNPLTNLSLTENSALEILYCNDALLTDLDITNNILLSKIYCARNQITSLDASRQSNLNSLIINNNQLNSLNIKNGNNNAINNIRFNVLNNPNLNLICVDNITYANTYFLRKDVQSFYSDICSFIPTNSNTITGTVSFDFNNNGCDNSDTKSINTKLKNSSNNTSNNTFTGTNGEYLIYTQEATNTVEIELNLPPFFSATPTSQSKTFTSSGETEVIDFCITANQIVNDVKVTVIPTFEARPGFDTSVRVYYENIGSSILSGTVDLAFLDTQLNFLNATVTPDTQTSTLLTWNYTNLNPFEKKYIDVDFNINTPVDPINPVNGGDQITYTSTITSTNTDVNLADNISTATELVVNSYDPNDITCFEGDYIDAVEIPNFLNYRVRFQNTGTASAINIVVRNELDEDLDWDTFTPISASHSYRPSISDGNKLEFIFENIHLADSLSNEPESHGWVFFKIKPKSTLSLNDIIENTSYIYFDYNAPIITNTASTQLTRVATLSTTTANNITQTSADLAGDITSNGGATISERGIVYALSSENNNPEIGGTDVIKIINGTGTGMFTNSLTNLIPNTQYSFKSYAINSAGTSYGNLESFTTNSLLMPSINFTDISKTYGDDDFQLLATSDSAGQISYSIQGNANGTTLVGTNNDFINIGEAGNVTIRVNIAEHDNYSSNTKDITLSVNKKAITITADDISKVYGDVNPTFTMTYNGFVNGDTAAQIDTQPDITSIATQNSDAGQYDITLANGMDNNYSFSLTNGTLSVNKKAITITADDLSKVYGDVNPTFTMTYDGFVNGDTAAQIDAQPNITSIATQNSDAGQYDITLANGMDNNYSFSLTNGTLSVNKKAITITADDLSKVYGDVNPTFTMTYDGFVNGDTVAQIDAQPDIASIATQNSDAGQYDITLANGMDNNYSFSLTNGTLSVNKKAITITADDLSKVYGDANPTFTMTYDGFVNGDTAAEIDAQPDITSIATQNSDAGQYDITLANGMDNNYSFSLTNGTLSINKKAITITADDLSKVYGDVNPTFTMTYDGFVNGDTVAQIDAQPDIASIATQNSDAGQYDITLANGMDNNYSFSLTNGTLSINKKAITITADDIVKNFGDTDPILTYQITSGSLVNGDSFSGGLNRESGESIGTYKIQIGNLTGGSNYNENFIEGVFTISTTANVTSNVLSSKYKIYPNPAKERFTIFTEESAKTILYDINGKQLKEFNINIGENKIDTNNLPKGIYILKTVGSNFSKTSKIVIE
ncbi:MBG domain-containing protein [uncultured Polaribacter sp.]|uniref:MBG domain-containing protein n=1 Tax=uncultured Polaribacter sp. TaxID=174711 RepID=UPI002610F635|nr:MBG domain-containing protein [uncultured Polaribacter sp.]